MNDLKVALISLDISPGDKQANLSRLQDCVALIPSDVDLVVIPELFSTSFTSNRDKLASWAESDEESTISELKKMSSTKDFAICGSYLAKTDGKLYNRAFFIGPDGRTTFYDKRHLFSMSSESKVLSGGKAPMPVIAYKGWNIAVSVCYDLRFPVWCRNVAMKYDVLVVPANWPSSRGYAWRHLLAARAIENQAYVLGVDRSGEDKFGNYDSMTLAVDYCGKELASTSEDIVMVVVLDHSSLERWRSDFPAWADADQFSIDL